MPGRLKLTAANKPSKKKKRKQRKKEAEETTEQVAKHKMMSMVSLVSSKMVTSLMICAQRQMQPPRARCVSR